MCCPSQECPAAPAPPPPAMLRTWRVELDLDVKNDTGEIVAARFVSSDNVGNLITDPKFLRSRRRMLRRCWDALRLPSAASEF